MHKNKFFLLACSLVLACTSLLSCTSGNKSDSGQINIALNFKEGEQYLYTTEVKQHINSAGMGTEQSMLMEMIYEVAGTENNNKKLRITYDRVKMSVGNVAFDSRDSSSQTDPDLGMVHTLIGKSFELYLAPDGEIVRVEGLEPFAALGAPGAENPFSDTAVRLMMQNSFDLYPGKPVAVGEQWVKKSQMGFSGIKVNVENTYTLKAVKDNEAEIIVKSVMNLPAMDMALAPGQNMKVEMQGTQDGTIEMDINSGRIIHSKTTQVIKGKMSMGGGELPMDISGDITIDSRKL